MQIFKKWVKIGEAVIRYFIPNKLDLTFWALNHCAKFHQNRMKIAAIGVFSDILTE